MKVFLCVAMLIAAAVAQPGLSTNGQQSDTTCTAATTCGSAGTANYVSRSLTYDKNTGIFSGTMTTNLCPTHATTGPTNTPSCVKQTFPAPDYATTQTFPKAAPLRGIVAYSIKVFV